MTLQMTFTLGIFDLRYSKPKSAEKWPFPQQNKNQKKNSVKILKYFTNSGAPNGLREWS